MKENIHPGTIIVPLLDIYKHELRLSTDVVYLFKESNLPLESLIFRDDVDLKVGKFIKIASFLLLLVF